MTDILLRPKQFPANVGGPGWPADMMQPVTWKWFLAVVDWDWRDSRAIDALLLSGDQKIPASLVRSIEAIRGGTRKRKAQNAVNAANIRGADRMRIAAHISNRLGLIDVNRFNADRIAERQETSARKLLAGYKALRKELFDETRDVWAFQSVSNEALENLVRELRGYAENWPNI